MNRDKLPSNRYERAKSHLIKEYDGKSVIRPNMEPVWFKSILNDLEDSKYISISRSTNTISIYKSSYEAMLEYLDVMGTL